MQTAGILVRVVVTVKFVVPCNVVVLTIETYFKVVCMTARLRYLNGILKHNMKDEGLFVITLPQDHIHHLSLSYVQLV